ncbi:MAG: GMC oxidoreductase, partial [Saprospiraceae bacterium]
RPHPISGMRTDYDELIGTNPEESVLDLNCKAHDLENLYVVDTSFFPSSGAVNPSLTAMANALRVGEYLRK